MTMNPRSSQPTFEFADDAPVRQGKKHRRGRGYMTRGKGSSAKSNGGSNTQSTSYRSGGHKYSSAASREASSAQHQPHYTANDWGENTLNLKGGNHGNGNNKDDNSCAGSLTYSASSSVQSAESSNDSSFADVLKLIDNEGEGASELKYFMDKQSKAAIGKGDGAVQAYHQRRGEDRNRAAQLQQLGMQAPMQAPPSRKKQQHQYTMASSRNVPTNGHVDLNYSKDDSSEDDVYGVDVDFDENVLETIAG